MATLDKNFERIVSEVLPDLARKTSDGLRGIAYRPVSNLGTDAVPGPSPVDPDSINSFFNSDDAGQTYFKAVTASEDEFNKQTVRISAKIQSDILSQLKRDFKLQTMSRIRATAMEASRRSKQAGPDGPIVNDILHGARFWFNIRS